MDGSQRRGEHHHAQGGRPGGGLVEDMPGGRGVRNTEVGAQALRGRQDQLADPDRTQGPPTPRDGWAVRTPGLVCGWRSHRGNLGPPGQPAQCLGLLDCRSVPVAAGLTAGQVLIDAGGRYRFAFAVDTCRQRLTSGVAVHVSIVAQTGRFVPADAQRAALI